MLGLFAIAAFIYSFVTSPPLFVPVIFLICGNNFIRPYVFNSPLFGSSLFANTFNKVVFPVPFFPTSPIRSCSCICKCSILINTLSFTEKFKLFASNSILSPPFIYDGGIKNATLQIQNRRQKRQLQYGQLSKKTVIASQSYSEKILKA